MRSCRRIRRNLPAILMRPVDPIAGADAKLGRPSAGDFEHRRDRFARPAPVPATTARRWRSARCCRRARIKIMSSGISVSLHPERHRLRRIVGEDHAAIGAERPAVHQACLLLLRRARDFDDEPVGLRARADVERHLLEAGGGALGQQRRRRAAGGACRHGGGKHQRGAEDQCGARSSTAVRPLELGATRASNCCPGCSSPRPDWRTVSMWTNTSSSSPPRLTKP